MNRIPRHLAVLIFPAFILGNAGLSQVARAGDMCGCDMKNCSVHGAMNARGDAAMGFSHEKPTHHFLLSSDGGVIAVQANDAADTQSVTQIRAHLQHIASRFTEGDFNIPMLIHDRVPPGVPAMRRLRRDIRYAFVAEERGGQVQIRSANPKAIAAVHEFLRFQIQDHGTGDPLEIPAPAR